MKHQGIEGFTWDSKAEEWAAWCISVWEHNDPKKPQQQRSHQVMANAYISEYAKDAIRRHAEARAPTNQWSDPDPYRVISWRDYPPSGVNLWAPTLALILATVLFAWQAGYL